MPGAASSARAINARAYTLGNDVIFGAGQYSPNSSEGRHLLAHELTHVIQQSSKTAQKPILSDAQDPYQQHKLRSVFDAVANLSAEESFGYSTSIDKNLKTQSEISRPIKASDDSFGVIFRSESVHPEEQYCQDLSQDETASCGAIIQCIEDMIEALAGRFSQLAGDPGHLQRIQIVQSILGAVMTLAAIACKNGEFDKELEDEAKKWRNKNPDQKTEPVTDEQKKILRERLPTVPEWVWVAVGAVVVGLIIACFATGVCEAGAIVAAIVAAVGTAGEFIAGIIIAAMRLAGLLGAPG